MSRFADVSKISAPMDAAYCEAVSYETVRCAVRSALLHAIASTSGSSGGWLSFSSRTHSLSFSNELSSVIANTKMAATAPR